MTLSASSTSFNCTIYEFGRGFSSSNPSSKYASSSQSSFNKSKASSLDLKTVDLTSSLLDTNSSTSSIFSSLISSSKNTSISSNLPCVSITKELILKISINTAPNIISTAEIEDTEANPIPRFLHIPWKPCLVTFLTNLNLKSITALLFISDYGSILYSYYSFLHTIYNLFSMSSH